MCDSPPIQSDMTETVLARLRSLQELTDFTENCQKQLNELFETLGWDQELDTPPSIQEPTEVCPYDQNHRVPGKGMDKHKSTCLLNKLGYSREEQAEMIDPSVCYEKANIPSCIMDKATQRQVILQARASAAPIRIDGHYSQSDFSTDPGHVPQNHKRATCDLTVADRLALYDHVMTEVGQQREPSEAANNEDLYVDLVAKLKKGEDQNGPKSHLEVLAEKRDYKRRRQSYRAKNVHITKKSYTEVIREVIDVHSNELSRQWQLEEKEEPSSSRESKHPHHRRRSEEQRSPEPEPRLPHLSSREERAPQRRRHGERERSPEQEKRKKKRKSRGSESPEDENHDRKKKKKKKKK